jgi:hypothetical protein
VAREHLARWLVNHRRLADRLINQQCDPLPTWDEASEAYRDGARREAEAILRGER